MDELINEKDSGWSSWKIYVIKSLENHQSDISKIENDFRKYKEDVEKDIIEIKTKIGLWSIIVSFITSFIITVISGIIIYNYSHDYHNNQEIKHNIIEQKTTNGE